MDNISDSEIPNSSSLPSEPPDIRNWFSSYKYESFVLDTYDPLGGSNFKESDFEEHSLADVADINGEKEANVGESDDKHEEQSLIKMQDSTCSLSVISEPPHIKNWFSSYVYESPVLNTSEYLRENNKVDSVDEELWPNKCTNSFEDTCANKPSCEIPDSSQTPSALSEPPDITNWFSSYVYKSPESNGTGDEETEGEEDCIVNQHKREKEMNSSEFGQTSITYEVVTDEKVNSSGVLRFDEEQENLSLDWQQNQNSLVEDDVVSSKGRVPKRKLILKKDLSGNSETKAQADSRELKSKLSGINGNENKENEVPRNGFITTKYRPRLNNETNSMDKPKFGLKKCSGKEGRSEAVERRVLSERSNLEQAEAIGITGKWQCPQSKKPKLGPPLKQLRLERWINKL